MNLYKKIFTKFDAAKIEYLLVGGVAVNLYGYSRFTADIDIILALNRDNLENLDKLMHEMGYVERQPITLKELGSAKKIESLLNEKGMKAFTFVSSTMPQLDLDIIVEESLEFEAYDERKTVVEIWDLKLPMISIDDLIVMKKNAAREKDKIDLEALLKIKNGL